MCVRVWGDILDETQSSRTAPSVGACPLYTNRVNPTCRHALQREVNHQSVQPPDSQSPTGVELVWSNIWTTSAGARVQ